MELISIILPVYNSEEYLSKCIKSIIEQTYHKWELIVINDGSTDGSKNIIDYYSQIDNRINAFHFDNRGVSCSRNFGIEQALGEFVTFVDSDDYIKPDYLEKLMISITENNSDLSVCDVLEVYKNDSHIIKSFDTIRETVTVVESQRILDDLLYHKIKNGFCCAKAFRKSIIKQLFQSFCYCEDVLFLVNYLAYNDLTISIVHEPLYVYVKNENSVTMKKDPDKIIDMLNVSEKIIDESSTNKKIKLKAAQALIIDYSFYIFLFSRKVMGLEQLSIICKNNIKKYRKKVLFDIHSSLKTKIACILSFFPDFIMMFIYNHQPKKSL